MKIETNVVLNLIEQSKKRKHELVIINFKNSSEFDRKISQSFLTPTSQNSPTINQNSLNRLKCLFGVRQNIEDPVFQMLFSQEYWNDYYKNKNTVRLHFIIFLLFFSLLMKSFLSIRKLNGTIVLRRLFQYLTNPLDQKNRFSKHFILVRLETSKIISFVSLVKSSHFRLWNIETWKRSCTTRLGQRNCQYRLQRFCCEVYVFQIYRTQRCLCAW